MPVDTSLVYLGGNTLPVALFEKHGGRIKLAKYTASIPRRRSEALIKHPSEALLVFPLSSSVSLTPHHPLTQAFSILSRGSTGGSCAASCEARLSGEEKKIHPIL